MRILRNIISIWVYSLIFIPAQAQLPPEVESFPFQPGDLIFQDMDCDLCHAIKEVTEGYNGQQYAHIGLVAIQGKDIFVIEAIGDSVQSTPLQPFLNRSNYKATVGRLKKEFQYLIPAALLYADSMKGIPYDDEFLYDNGKYYCSELIYDAFKYANNGIDVFVLAPMTFKKLGTDQFSPVWVNYYLKLGIPIPEGEPGCNPGGISLSDKIEILKHF
jgi:hypothetical protein